MNDWLARECQMLSVFDRASEAFGSAAASHGDTDIDGASASYSGKHRAGGESSTWSCGHEAAEGAGPCASNVPQQRWMLALESESVTTFKGTHSGLPDTRLSPCPYTRSAVCCVAVYFGRTAIICLLYSCSHRKPWPECCIRCSFDAVCCTSPKDAQQPMLTCDPLCPPSHHHRHRGYAAGVSTYPSAPCLV